MYRALVSFSGRISMSDGDVRDITDKALAADLLRCGYIEEVKPHSKADAKAEPEVKAEPEAKAEEKPKRKSGRKKTTKKK